MTKTMFVLFGLACLGLAACGSHTGSHSDDRQAPSAASASAAGVVYEIELDDATVVSFHAWEDEGAIAVSAEGDQTVAPLNQRYALQGSLTQIFRQLKPGERIPEELVRVQGRLDAIWREQLRSSDTTQSEPISAPTELVFSHRGLVSDEPDEPTLIPKHNSHEWFEDEFCTTERLQVYDDYGSVEDCDLHQSGTSTAESGLVREAHGAGSSYDGTIRMIVERAYAGSGGTPSFTEKFNKTIDEGYWRSYWIHNPSRNMYVLYWITDASGDHYHRSRVVGPTIVCKDYCSFNGQVCSCGI